MSIEISDKVKTVGVALAGALVINGGLAYGGVRSKIIKENEILQEKLNHMHISNLKEQSNIKYLKDEVKELLEDKKRLEKRVEDLEKEKQVNRSQLEGRRSKTYIGDFVATAYDDSPQSQGKWVGKTATGVKPAVGVIAVDPKVIPLHTKLEIRDENNNVVYSGFAGDTGGAIKGNRLDLFMNTRKECYNWGRKKVKVYIVK